MREKLNGVKYRTDAEFIADGLLVFQNCQQYNMEDTDEYNAGVKLCKYFKKKALELGLSLDTDASDAIDQASNATTSKSKRVITKKKRQSM